MLLLSKFKDKHKHKDIYILASGKSVDFLPTSFLENKIVIGVNQAYKYYVPTYLVRKECKLIDTVLKECPQTIHFISKGDCGNTNTKNSELLTTHNYFNQKDKIVVYNHLNNIGNLTSLPPKGHLIVSNSTITTAIHLAAYMGAKNIILVGHDCGTINGHPNFKGYHSDSTYKIAHKNGKTDYINWLSKIENQTIKLKSLLKKQYGCNVVSINPFINFWLEGNTLNRK